MDTLQIERLREHLQGFNFPQLFIDELGWSQVQGQQSYSVTVKNDVWNLTAIAELSGAVAFVIATLPEQEIRLAIHHAISELVHENLLIFVEGSTCLWLWVKRNGKQRNSYEHRYDQSQSGDLFLSKLSNLYVSMNDMDEQGWFPLGALTEQIKKAFDVEQVTKKFFGAYEKEHAAFQNAIQGVDSEKEQKWLASVLIHRLIFIWFLQRKLFLDGKINYLQDKLSASQQRGADQFYSEFLQALFFEGFAKPPEQRSAATQQLIGEICFLNGGLFLPHHLEIKYQQSMQIPDAAFTQLFKFFHSYSWHLDDTPGGDDRKINPDVLGYIFEKYINQRKSFGAYYTRPQITDYLCERTIQRLIVERIHQHGGLETQRAGEGIRDLIGRLNAPQCLYVLNELPKLKLLDPACGSGAFLIAALKTLYDIYYFTIAAARGFKKHVELSTALKKWDDPKKSLEYTIKRTIITSNLFGVEIVEEAVEIAKLRLFLALVATAESVEQLEPLPNIDFNVVTGNSLIGLMQVDAEEFAKKNPSGSLALNKSYRELVNEKNRLITIYRDTVTSFDGVNLSQIKHEIELNQAEAQPVLNEILLTKMGDCGIRFEQATWDAAKNKMGKPKKRQLQAADIAALHPFHWGFEFNQVLESGGFHAIITNPPWEIVKPNAKEFFQEHSELVTKNKMTIKEFEKAQDQLLADVTIREEWLAYLSNFAHQSAWFRAAPQFKFQSAVVNGKKTGSDINLYKLFTEQCVNLLRPGGACGIVIPSGIYTDLGAKGLRDLLFDYCQIAVLFGLSNEKFIFDEVHHAQKFCLMIFAKGEKTSAFEAAFRINPREAITPQNLESFLRIQSLHFSYPVNLINRASPDSRSVMEFKSDADIRIIEKLLKFPLIGEKIENTWNLRLTREFDMTNDSHLFKTEAGAGRLPLFEGKMIHQFTHQWGKPKYWLNEDEARADLLGRYSDIGQELAYQNYRLGMRAVASSTNERSLISNLLPAHVFCGNSVFSSTQPNDAKILVFISTLLNSFVIDYFLRLKVTSNLNLFLVYPTPIPRLTAADPAFNPIVSRAAQLICTTPEFDELAVAVGLGSFRDGVTDAVKRAQLRAELDGLIAHLYGLNENEFTHILATFPLVAAEIKAAALAAYRVSCDN